MSRAPLFGPLIPLPVGDVVAGDSSAIGQSIPDVSGAPKLHEKPFSLGGASGRDKVGGSNYESEVFLPLRLWIEVRQRDNTREVAVRRCRSRGQPVLRDLFPAAPPPITACGASLTCEGRMSGLFSMGRVMVMLALAHGAGMPGALSYAAAQRMMAAMMKRHAAVRSPCYPFFFSRNAAYMARDVVLSTDRLTVSLPSAPPGYTSFAWVRSEGGIGAECGIARWAVELGRESGGDKFKVGVASAAFHEYTVYEPKQSWFFLNDRMFADGREQAYFGANPCFAAGDVVTVELERVPGVGGVLRVWVAGKRPRELRGLPKDGMLYPIVCLGNNVHRMSLVPLP